VYAMSSWSWLSNLRTRAFLFSWIFLLLLVAGARPSCHDSVTPVWSVQGCMGHRQVCTGLISFCIAASGKWKRPLAFHQILLHLWQFILELISYMHSP
jgi:hypothetical protein